MGTDIVNKNSTIQLDSFQMDLAERVLEQLDTLGQSGLEVMTSGGKSYIAAYIMSEYVNKHRHGKILWIAPKSAINNVRNKIFAKTALRNKIEYLGYEELSRGNTVVKYENDIRLIVFDECHKAYAKKTYKSLQALLEKLQDTDRLAMSATPVRYNGLNTFSVLVPKVTEPIQFSIEDASLHNLLPNVLYVLANITISAADFSVLSKYKKIAETNEEAKRLYSEVEDTFKSFKFDMRKDLGELLKTHINSNGESGERHIAFFKSIEILKGMKPSIEEAFKIAYPGCTINILEYHSKLTDEENSKAFKQFVLDEPEPNRIDVLLSVDKATESIHPDNVRSVLMFRGTESLRIYLQQMGRGLMLKSYHPEDVVIFDFAENVGCLGDSKSYKDIDLGASGNSHFDTVDSVKNAIMRQFGYSKGLETRIGIERINACVEKLHEISKIRNINNLIVSINRAIRAHAWLVQHGERPETDNIHTILHNIAEDIEIGTLKASSIYKGNPANFDKYWSSLSKYFTKYQNEYLFSNKPIIPKLKEFFDSLGHSAYLVYGNGKLSSKVLDDIDYIKSNIEKYGSIENSKNTHAKHKIKQLRIDYTKGTITENIRVYAERQGININVATSSMADIARLCETDKDREVIQAFKPIDKALSNIDIDIMDGNDISFEDWSNIIIKLTITYRRYRDTEMGLLCHSYIQSEYGYIIDAYKMTQYERENMAKLVSILFKVSAGEFPNKTEEQFIFEHSGMNGFSEFEIKILKEMGITKLKYTPEVEEKTEFIYLYNRALEGDPDALRVMLAYDKTGLDPKRKKLLNTNKFNSLKDSVKETLGSEVLLKKAKAMCDSSEDYKKLRSELSKALTNETITSLELALTPFREYDKELASKVLNASDEEFTEYKTAEYSNTPLSALVTRCNQSSNCAKAVIENLLKIQEFKGTYRERLDFIHSVLD